MQSVVAGDLRLNYVRADWIEEHPCAHLVKRPLKLVHLILAIDRLTFDSECDSAFVFVNAIERNEIPTVDLGCHPILTFYVINELLFLFDATHQIWP